MALATILQRYTPVLCDKSVVSGVGGGGGGGEDEGDRRWGGVVREGEND